MSPLLMALQLSFAEKPSLLRLFLAPVSEKGRPSKPKWILVQSLALTVIPSATTQPQSLIKLRSQVDDWRKLKDPNSWGVTPETARLLQHWRHHKFSEIRPFFCQVEAIEVAIWLTEVAPKLGNKTKVFLDHLDSANEDANPGLMRLALKLATGAGNTTAMVIAWQTIYTWFSDCCPRLDHSLL